MGRQQLSRKAWQRAVNALLWYPDNKQEYASLPDEISLTGDDTFDPTGDAAMQLSESRRYQTIKQEIDAVERAMQHLYKDQQAVIERRFWQIPKGHGIYRKPRQYDFLQDLGFSERTMRRISRQTILFVAFYLGEK